MPAARDGQAACGRGAREHPSRLRGRPAGVAAFAASRHEPPLPPRPETLSDYCAVLLTDGSPTAAEPRALAPSTVERRLAAVSTWAVEAGCGRPDLRAARLVLRGYRRTTPTATRQAAPVTVGVLRALTAQAATRRAPDGSLTIRALRDRAILLLGFAIGARRSELVRLDVTDLL